jgi:hypothetical protein
MTINEIRTGTADDLWLSPCYSHDAVAIHCTWKPDRTAVDTISAELETSLRPLSAHPHWSKLMHAQAPEIAALYLWLPKFRKLADDLYQPALIPTLIWFPRDRKYGSVSRLWRVARFTAGEDRMSAALEITRTDHSPVELRAFPAKSRDVAQARRLLTITMVLEGLSRLDAARQAGTDRQTLREWVHRYHAAGVGGLKSRTAPSLTEAQIGEFRDLVVAGSAPEIHGVVRWHWIDLRHEEAGASPLPWTKTPSANGSASST